MYVGVASMPESGDFSSTPFPPIRRLRLKLRNNAPRNELTAQLACPGHDRLFIPPSSINELCVRDITVSS
jgi:hypothetical protein